MLLRVFSFLTVLLFCTSCDYFSFRKERIETPIDSIVDFSSVNSFPSFKVCDSLIEATKKETCFRNTIHQKIGEELSKHTIKVKNAIDETVMVKLQISEKGKIHFIKKESTVNIEKELPQLDSILKVSIAKLPNIYPAIKRGIPITTEYSLPIRIKLED